MKETIDAYLAFMKETELLKSVTRTAWTGSGKQESTAEHSWHLALFAAVMLEEYPGLDIRKTLLMCLLHDIGEIYEGDISAALHPNSSRKYQEEYRAASRVFSLLPEKQKEDFMAVWQEYEDGQTPEARLVKALDKAETIIQHNTGKNPPDFDYDFNLQYGKSYFTDDILLEEMRNVLDSETKAHSKGQ